MSEGLLLLAMASLGAMVAAALAVVPGLHVLNVLGLVVWAYHTMAPAGVGTECLLAGAVGMLVGYALLNSIPSMLLASPDESALLTAGPGQRLLMEGRGYEGVLLTVMGGGAGLVVLAAFLVGPAPHLLPAVRLVLRPHLHWILWSVILFMLMSEWPRERGPALTGWRGLKDAWRSLLAGGVTFVLSGLMGFVLFYRTPVTAVSAYQGLMPAFVGFFGVPQLLLNALRGGRVPPQTTVLSRPVRARDLVQGIGAGCLGGGFASFFPAVTGGVGGLLAGHAASVRNERVFLISQGASRAVYYVGSLAMLTVPGLGLTRGGAAWLLRGVALPTGYAPHYTVVASICIAVAVSVLMARPLTGLVIRLIERAGIRRVSACALVLLVLLVRVVTGTGGLTVCLASAAVGMVPLLYGARRMNCLGVILLPLACNFSGWGGAVAEALGLLHLP